MKVDFKKELKALYNPKTKDFVEVIVPEFKFLMIDGAGNPNTATSYRKAVETLYAVSYKIKFYSKKQLDKDYIVPPLEGLWWAEDMLTFQSAEKDKWQWTMMIMQPDWINTEIYETCKAIVKKDKNPAALDLMRFERYNEGASLQIMHKGSYDDEAPVLARLHNEFIPQNGFIPNGKHHEIYLSDPRKVAAEKLKTILRQPVKKTV
jgi:hypothetical protein